MTQSSAIVVQLLLLAQSAPLTARQIEVKAIEQRNRIVSGDFELHSRFRKRLQSGLFSESLIERRIRFDKKNKRSDTRRGQLIEISLLTDKNHVFYTNEKTDTGEDLMLNLVNLDQHNKKMWQIVDPRMIGMIPIDHAILVNFHIGLVFDRAGRKGEFLEDTKLDGVGCWKIGFNAQGVTYTHWIDKNYNIIKMQSKFKDSGVEFLDTVVTTPRYFEAEGVWFLDRCHFTRLQGGVLAREELLDVHAKQINRPIDPSAFSPAGMDLPAGLLINRVPEDPRGQLAWDGKKIVAATIGDPQVKRGSATLLLVANAAALTGLALFFLGKHTRRVAAAAR